MFYRSVKLTLLFLALAGALFAQKLNVQKPSFDVLSYNAALQPKFDDRSIAGNVSIEFVSLADGLEEIKLSAGALEITSVKENLTDLTFQKKDSFLIIKLSRPLKLNERREIKIAYHGVPKYGMEFFPEQRQVYTIFSTSQWMPCVDSPDDRATFRLELIFPDDALSAVGNGRLVSQSIEYISPQSSRYVWEEKNPIPTYLFGFAAGKFKTVIEAHKKTNFQYLVPPGFSEMETRQIFRDSADMLDFFESKAGVKYPEKTYTQVLALGNAQQEMGSFSALNEKYGRGVLKDEKAIWLGVHEFAHQWWGNMVTNRDWTHFWLNEGIANFMTAAYLEHRFGRAEYLSEIKRYRESYQRVRDAGNDKSLVFPDWNKPTRDDRRLVYDKGAYVTHLLREELGEESFWKGIKKYTRKYRGRSVETKDLKSSMEAASGKDLSDFFDKWVYNKGK
ncbi:MAG: M1 family metallopeptidase [Acidobacteria bacterium]|nr:M1 family metallopeptidase [Acidobacteriota bacterium]